MDVPYVGVQRNETVKENNKASARIAGPFDHDVEKGLDRFQRIGGHGHINNLQAAAVDAVAQRRIGYARQRRGDQAGPDQDGHGTGEKDIGREYRLRRSPN